MSTVTINTHDAFKRLIGSEFSEQQAEGIIKIILTNIGTVIATVSILRYLGGAGG
jgi:hypothetical protein